MMTVDETPRSPPVRPAILLYQRRLFGPDDVEHASTFAMTHPEMT
jgi:hypothetical protein